MLILFSLGITLICVTYLAGLQKWIYQGNLLLGLVSVVICYPMLLSLTPAYPASLIRAIPLVGVGMFLHRYGSRILMQFKLLWFTTLSVLVVQGYFLLFGHFPAH